jgi:hypothetical protein
MPEEIASDDLGKKYLQAKQDRIKAKAAFDDATAQYEDTRTKLNAATDAEKKAEADYVASIPKPK